MAGDDSSKKGDSSSSNLKLVFGDPLYLHPNDTNGTPIVTVKLTGTKNYKVWSIAMTFALRNHNKIGFIDGTCEKDNTNHALSNQWDMCNSIVFTWILNSLSSDFYVGATYAKSAYELWNDLKDTYDKVDGSAIFNLHKKVIPLVKATFAIVSGEESHRNITSSGATKPTASMFAAKTFDKKRPITNNNTTVDPHSNKASSNTTSNYLVSLSNEQLTRLMNLLNDNGVSTANANMSVNVVDISNLGLTVGHPNGTHALITKTGDLKINNKITLYDVLVVPKYTISLLSVHKLSRDNKLFVGFNESNCYIQDLKSKQDSKDW
ncbi:ribonuclease H-like domain-containing protein [Tanacetum coccineum]